MIDERKWRISRSGYTIVTGLGDEKKVIAAYPYKSSPLDDEKFKEWIKNAELICDLRNRNYKDCINSILEYSEMILLHIDTEANSSAQQHANKHIRHFVDQITNQCEAILNG